MQIVMLLVFVVALGCNIFALKRKNLLFENLTKPLLTISLLLFYLFKQGEIHPLVVAALLAGLAGDVLLMFRGSFWFSAGLFAFLAGHLLYVLSFFFISGGLSGLGLGVWLAAIPYLVVGVLIFRELAPYVGEMKPQVILYIITIVSMGIASLTSLKRLDSPAFLLAIAGGILFIISDACLAFAKFKKVKGRDGLVMFTYGMAQLCLTLWFSLQG